MCVNYVSFDFNQNVWIENGGEIYVGILEGNYHGKCY